jgi:CubicO group peptidase (beta-lactamase class C family)
VPGDYAEAASAAGARWWASADQLLDYARLHLDDGAGRFAAEDVRELRRPHATIPGATVADAWGLGWSLWDRGDHRAFGWAGFTGGHRAYLRCFPDQDAALVLLANSAGPLFGPPGGSALLDALLPDLLELLGVPALREPERPDGHDVDVLAGGYGPLSLTAGGVDVLTLDAGAFGAPEPLTLRRVGGDTFVVDGDLPGGMPVAVDDGLLYLGPFAVPRNP